MPRTVTALAVATVAAMAVAAAPSQLASPVVGVDADDIVVFEPEGMQMHDCSQLFEGPAATSAGHVLGEDDIDLHVRLVLDLVDSGELDAVVDDPATQVDERQAAIDARGREIVEEYLAVGAQSYAALDITLSYASFDVLESSYLGGDRPATIDSQGTINLAKAQYGGTRPPGTDLVYVLTDLDLTAPVIGNSVAGQADCIGGITFPDRAFGVGEIDYDRGQDPGDLLDREFTAKIVSHEIGHLMGAHHHYQACGPYAATNAVDGYGVGACSLMTNAVNFATFPFAPVNEVVVRGHAEEWGADNDPADHADHDH